VFAYPGKPLQIGSKGDAVKLVQALVGGVITDGDFGKKTDHRVKEWQFAHNIAADGIVGPVSWKAMFG
jgi:peptidoglycan hydrolase-like protein with peptidoglycan-binding domain